MSTVAITEQIERLAEKLVLADPNDLPSLAALHTELEELGQAYSVDCGELAGVAQVAAGWVEQVILSEVDDPAGVLEDLGRVVANFQAVVRDGRDLAELAWPESFNATGEPAPARQAGPADAPAAEPSEPKPADALSGDPALLSEFINEAREHLDAADVSLLNLESDGGEDADALNAVFRAFHTIKGVAGFLALDDIQKLAHEAENLLDRARKHELKLTGPAMDVVFDSVDMMKRLVQNVADALQSGQPVQAAPGLPELVEQVKLAASGKTMPVEPDDVPSENPRMPLGEILVDRGTVTKDAVNSALVQQRMTDPAGKLGEILVRQGQASAKDVAQALRLQNASQAAGAQVRETLKVDADRLDLLVDMIGELVIAESMVSQSGELRRACSPDLARSVMQLDKITRELQEMGTSLRMVPIKATFQKMARLVRDLARKSGKEVSFVASGEDTELDKSVVDKIGDPLVHMVRNAVDHGLEPDAESRVQAGKPAAGRVELRAFHKGGNIYIEVADDGRGLDREAILAKARARGIVRDGDVLSDHEVLNLIFEPGLSTAKTVTDVSGRGVGMDVVKRNIEALRGQVEIQSEPNRGTTFSIRLPLTLAIIDGMVVRIGRERYILPTLSIVMSLRPGAGQISSIVNRGEMLMLQGKLLPLFRLGDLFEIQEAGRDIEGGIVVVVEDEGRRVGLLVDDILGQQQTVIKSLGETLQGQPGVSGGAIMPDGTVGLILDVSGVVRLANEEGNPANAVEAIS